MKNFSLNTCFNQINQPKFYQITSKKKINIDKIFDLHINIVSGLNISKDVTKSHSLFNKGSFRKTLNSSFLTLDSRDITSTTLARFSQNIIIIFEKTNADKYFFVEFENFASKIQFLNSYYINLSLLNIPSTFLFSKKKKSKLKKINL